MRGLQFVFLAVLLCSECSLGLQCYRCVEPKVTSLQCEFIQCQGVCFRNSVSLTQVNSTAIMEGKDKLHVRGCAPSCDLNKNTKIVYSLLGKLYQDFTVHVNDVICCEKDSCNSNSGSHLQALGSAGFLFSLGSTLLCRLL